MINSCNKTKYSYMHYFLNFFFGIKFYMFRTVPLSIIRRFSLNTQQWYMSYMNEVFHLIHVTSQQHRRCVIPQAVNSLVLLRMGQTISRNVSSWLTLLMNCHCCIWLVVYIIITITIGRDLFMSLYGYIHSNCPLCI